MRRSVASCTWLASASTTGRPRAASSAPWNRRSRPCPPESTTCASRRIGSSEGVFATARSAASTVAASTVSTLLSRSAAATAAADASRMTVRIVPSTGLATALYAVFVPASSACARSRPLNRFLPWRPWAIPARIWLVMTPELPRAPMSAPKLAAWATRSASAPAPARSASSRAARTVASMLVPVSPSGTGKTLSELISSTFASRLATADRKAARNPAPSHERRAIRRRPSRTPRDRTSAAPRFRRRRPARCRARDGGGRSGS